MNLWKTKQKENDSTPGLGALYQLRANNSANPEASAPKSVQLKSMPYHQRLVDLVQGSVEDGPDKSPDGFSDPAPVQQAGDQAVVQMCKDWDSQEAWDIYNQFKDRCTANFIRRHIYGLVYQREPSATRLSPQLVNEVCQAYADNSFRTGPDGWGMYKNRYYAFTDDGKLCHYEGRRQ